MRNPIGIVDGWAVSRMQGVINRLGARGIPTVTVLRVTVELYGALLVVMFAFHLLKSMTSGGLALTVLLPLQVLNIMLSMLGLWVVHAEVRRMESTVGRGRAAQSSILTYASLFGMLLRCMCAYAPMAVMLAEMCGSVVAIVTHSFAMPLLRHVVDDICSVAQSVVVVAMACVFTPPAQRKKSLGRLEAFASEGA